MTMGSILGMSVGVHSNTSEFSDKNYLNSVSDEGECLNRFGVSTLDNVGVH